MQLRPRGAAFWDLEFEQVDRYQAEMAQKRKLEEVEEFNSVGIVAKFHSIVATFCQ